MDLGKGTSLGGLLNRRNTKTLKYWKTTSNCYDTEHSRPDPSENPDKKMNDKADSNDHHENKNYYMGEDDQDMYERGIFI